jgi:HEPN domain-containing protein
MNKEILKEQELFYEFIKNYEYIKDNGRLDLEAFCVNLSTCFACDNILELSPRPRDMYDLLIQMLSDHAQSDEMSLWVQRQNLIDWEPIHSNMYPDKYRTYIHIAGLIKVLPHWIYNIGHTFMEIPEPDKPGKYFAWVKQDWTFVYTFINGFHNFFFNYLKDFDKSTSSKSGYSLFETLHKSKSEDMDFDEAGENIKRRNNAQKYALDRVEKAIESGFYLEAVTLSECIISNCLYNYLEAKGITLSSYNLNKLIKLSKDKLDNQLDLMDELDVWRAQRNKAVHGFVESSIENMTTSQDEFMQFSKSAAEKGHELCKKTFEWYLSCAVNFIKTSFKSSEKSNQTI